MIAQKEIILILFENYFSNTFGVQAKKGSTVALDASLNHVVLPQPLAYLHFGSCMTFYTKTLGIGTYWAMQDLRH